MAVAEREVVLAEEEIIDREYSLLNDCYQKRKYRIVTRRHSNPQVTGFQSQYYRIDSVKGSLAVDDRTFGIRVPQEVGLGSSNWTDEGETIEGAHKKAFEYVSFRVESGLSGWA